jgi:hypothetical protein
MRMFEALKTYIAQLTDEPARDKGWPFFTGQRGKYRVVPDADVKSEQSRGAGSAVPTRRGPTSCILATSDRVGTADLAPSHQTTICGRLCPPYGLLSNGR